MFFNAFSKFDTYRVTRARVTGVGILCFVNKFRVLLQMCCIGIVFNLMLLFLLLIKLLNTLNHFILIVCHKLPQVICKKKNGNLFILSILIFDQLNFNIGTLPNLLLKKTQLTSTRRARAYVKVFICFLHFPPNFYTY